MDFFQQALGPAWPAIWTLIKIVVIVVALMASVAYLTLAERKVIGYMQVRIGPNRVGPFGLLQPFADVAKLVFKEIVVPSGANRYLFFIAPLLALGPALAAWAVVPFSDGLVLSDINAGLLYVLALSSIGVYGIILAGWASNSKYAFLGALRSAAQIVSYEIPLTLSVVGLLLLAGTMSLNQLVENQQGWFTDWYIFQQPLGALIFFIAATAEANRTPFDLTEADSEIVAGFATEYSGMRFGFFFFAEYVNVFIVSALFVTLFLGGWNAPFALPAAWQVQLSLDPASFNIGLLFIIALAPVVLTLLFGAPFWLLSSRITWWQALLIGFVLANLFIITLAVAWAYIGLNWVAGILWFMLKTYVLVFTFVWMRGTLPRVRIDQLMGFAWKWLLPASLLNLFVTAAAIVVIGR